MICLNCHAISPQDARFCNSCGTPLKTKSSAAISQARRLNIRKLWVKANADSQPAKEPEHLLPWLWDSLKLAIREIPKHLTSLAIYGGIVLAINLIFWTANLYNIPAWLAPLRGVISTVVFLTATYNDIVPKTVFWVIVFTFGKQLFSAIKHKGFAKSFACLQKIGPEFSTALRETGAKGWRVLLIGAGAGLIVANNFASYSRFSQARNKIDKYFVVLIIAFTISYLLGEAKKTGLFRFVKLGVNDVARLFGRPAALTDSSTWLALSGFVVGLILDAPLIFMKWMYGGYIMGTLAIIAGIVLNILAARRPR